MLISKISEKFSDLFLFFQLWAITYMCVCIHVCCAVLSCFNHVQLFATLWTVAHQAPLSMGFSRQEHWSGLPCPPPGALPDPGMEPGSLTPPALAGGVFTTNAVCSRARTEPRAPQGSSLLEFSAKTPPSPQRYSS